MNECCAAGQEVGGDSAGLLFVLGVFFYANPSTLMHGDLTRYSQWGRAPDPWWSRSCWWSWAETPRCLGCAWRFFPVKNKRRWWGERKGTSERRTSIVEFSKMKTLGRYYCLRVSSCSPRCNCVLQSPPVQPFIINVTNGELGDMVLQLLLASHHQNWSVSAECSNFTVCSDDVFTVKADSSVARTVQMRHAATVGWKQTLMQRRSTSGLVSTAVLCSQAVQHIFRF